MHERHAKHVITFGIIDGLFVILEPFQLVEVARVGKGKILLFDFAIEGSVLTRSVVVFTVAR